MTRNLFEGMSGKDVRAIQQALNIWMPNRKPLVDDGRFGPLTKAAVIAFQTQRQLKPDGIVGPYTLTAIYPVAPYYGIGVVVRGAGSGGGVRSAQTAPVAARPGSLVLDQIAGLPFPAPLPKPPANPLPNTPGLPAQRQNLTQSPGSTPSSGVRFQTTQYQLGTTTTWPLNFSKPGVTGLQLTVKGLFLLNGKALTLATGATGTVAVDNGAKDVAAGIFQIAWAPSFLEFGDLASLSMIAQLAVGVLKVKGSSQGAAFFNQEALNIKLALDKRFFIQSGITLTQDSNTGNLGLHAPTPGFGVAAGVTF